MSIAMDSPMEALPLNYLKNQAFLTAANATVWAWIAFLTAAISFSWKIKSSIIHSSSSLPPPPPPHHHSSNHQLPSTSSLTPSSSTTFCWLENTRSGKFSIHYAQPHHDDENQECLRSHEEEEEEERGRMRLDYDDESMKTSSSIMHKDDGYFEVVLKMKTREMGWYRYQDLSMLDGNVVRFWTE